MMSLRCRSCNTAFHDNGSLEVHFQYAHSNGDNVAESSRHEQLPDAETTTATTAPENNNHFYGKYQGIENSNDSVMTAISPGTDNREFQLGPPVQHRDHLMYDVSQQNYPDTFMLNSHEYSRGSPIIQNSGGAYAFPANDQRFHPYYKQGFRELPPRNQVTAPPPSSHPVALRCDKCDFMCASQDVLMHHFNVAHGTIPSLGIHSFNPRFGNAPPPVNGGAEPQAEILDLDSHKVHVYQPPNGEDSQDSDHRNSMDPWMHEDNKKYFHHQLHISQQNGGGPGGGNGATNGKAGGTPLPSPDFGSVSTTTDNIENLQSTRSPYYEPNPNVNSTPTQISSSDNPTGRSSSKSGKNTNGTWKSNEARRPKTYNCSACNKWFTSSGHLKRHYNTTLHKNAVKQSGAPDPATMPVSAHHHPHKDPTYSSSRQVKNSPPVSSESSDTSPAASTGKLNDAPFSSRGSSQVSSAPPPNAFLHNSPNLMAGPSEMPGGLLHHPSYTQSTPDLIKSPSPITALPPPHSNHTNYLPFGTTPQPPHTLPFFQQHTPTTLYPNFQSPHVSTTHQVTTNSHTGNLTNVPATMTANSEDCSKTSATLPSFACIQKSPWNSQNLGLEQFLNTLDNGGNVGGSFTSNHDDAQLFTNLEPNSKCPDSECEDKYMVGGLKQEYGIKQEYVDQEYVDVKPQLEYTESVIKQEYVDETQPRSSLSPVADANVTSSTVEQISPPENRGYNCTRCQKHFNKACYLTQHNKSFHSGYKPFKCGRCGKRFQDTEQFKVHSDKHAGDKPYKCEICPKQFNHKTDLRRHACLHTNVRPFSCDICSKGFIRKDHMLKHRDTHQNRKNMQKRTRAVKVKKEIDFDF